MNNDLYIHANGLIERFLQKAEEAIARRDWAAAQAWYNAVSVVQEPETNAEILKQYPTAKLPTAVEFKHIAQGKWIEYIDEYPDGNVITVDWSCSICGGYGCNDYNFCPNCGADMRKEANDE